MKCVTGASSYLRMDRKAGVDASIAGASLRVVLCLRWLVDNGSRWIILTVGLFRRVEGLSSDRAYGVCVGLSVVVLLCINLRVCVSCCSCVASS